MSHRHIQTYLADHRAGAASALELLKYLEQVAPELTGFADDLTTEINSDIAALDDIMKRAGVEQSSVRTSGAWVAEKVAQLKMRIDDPGDGSLRLLETLEALALGIEGKRALWASLASASGQSPALAGDFQALTRRADDQRRGVEAQRLSAATSALKQ